MNIGGGAESDLITGGSFGSSPVLTTTAGGAVFYQPKWRVARYAASASVFTAIVQVAIIVASTLFGIPAVTVLFVLVTWMFLRPGRCLAPTAAEARDVALPKAV